MTAVASLTVDRPPVVAKQPEVLGAQGGKDRQVRIIRYLNADTTDQSRHRAVCFGLDPAGPML